MLITGMENSQKSNLHVFRLHNVTFGQVLQVAHFIIKRPNITEKVFCWQMIIVAHKILDSRQWQEKSDEHVSFQSAGNTVSMPRRKNVSLCNEHISRESCKIYWT